MYIRDANGNYVPVPTITGDDGREVELRATTTYIQWRYPDTEWTNLVALSDLASGFGTPSASVTALSADAVPTVAIQASGANTAKVFAFSFGIPRGTPGTGNNWYLGTAITGTSNTAASYTTGITNALVNDVYMNVGALPDTGRIYRCTVGGNATTAKWVYSCLLRGADAVPATDFLATLAVASWVGASAPYTQTVGGLTGVISTSKLDVGLADTATDAQYAEAVAAQIRATGSDTGTVTFKAHGAKPTLALPIIIRMVN